MTTIRDGNRQLEVGKRESGTGSRKLEVQKREWTRNTRKMDAVRLAASGSREQKGIVIPSRWQHNVTGRSSKSLENGLRLQVLHQSHCRGATSHFPCTRIEEPARMDCRNPSCQRDELRKLITKRIAKALTNSKVAHGTGTSTGNDATIVATREHCYLTRVHGRRTRASSEIFVLKKIMCLIVIGTC